MVSHFIRISYFILVALTLSSVSLFSQTNNFQKAISIQKGSFVSINDSTIYFSNDTIIIISNTYMTEDSAEYHQTLVFYDSLKARASHKKFTKLLYNLTIAPPSNTNPDKINELSVEAYNGHSGKIIRKIVFKRLNVFGTSIYDPDAARNDKSQYFLNKTHIRTREYVLRNYLLLSEGDSLSSIKVSESERILRRLSYINDARILVIPINSNEVDIIIITKDNYSLGMTTDIHGYNVGQVRIFDKNALGFGHEFELYIPWNYRQFNSTGLGFIYRINNINQSMIDAEFRYRNAFGKRNLSAEISKEFITAFTRYAGKLIISEKYILEDLDTLTIPEPVEYNNFDLWLGRSFIINKSELTRAVFSFRYINNNVWERPEIASNSYYKYQKYKIYLYSFSLVQQKFYKSNLIYNYGRNEDIPYGGILELTYGKEFNEYNKRDYVGIKLAYGNFINNIGYLYLKSNFSTFLRSDITEQGFLNHNLRYISNLYSTRSYYLRFFCNLDYSRGYYRYTDEYFDVGEDNGIRGFRNDSIFPDQRLFLNFETVAFNKKFNYGFRYALFGFVDLALISNNKPYYEYDNLISGIGLGIRVRNENLIFPTFQIRLGFYPSPPIFSRLRPIDVTNERLLNPPGFDPVAPEVIRLR